MTRIVELGQEGKYLWKCLIHEIPLCDNWLPHIFQSLRDSDERAVPPNATVGWNEILEWNVTLSLLTFQYFKVIDSDGYQSPVVDWVDVDVDELDAEREALANGNPIHLIIIMVLKND